MTNSTPIKQNKETLTEEELSKAINFLKKNDVRAHFGMIGHEDDRWVELGLWEAFKARIKFIYHKKLFEMSNKP
jgi:uncharacterized cupin superfamily protein